MTAFKQDSNSPFLAESAEQNKITPAVTSGNFNRGSLPSPKGAASTVVDSGRIRFGAGFRLPTSK